MRKLGFALLLFASPAHAGFYSGNELFDACSASSRNGSCLGYVAGVADTAQMLDQQYFCASEEVTLGQMYDVVSAYLAAHPEKRHFPAQGIALVALAEAFPCQ